MIKEQNSYILWLPSWYPNKLEPYNGDFIQRHAKATALYNPITLIYFTQYGETVRGSFNVEIREDDNLKEVIVYVPFVPMKIGFIDRLCYNLKFYFFAKKFLKNYFKQWGLPCLVHVHVPVKAGSLALWIKNKFKIPYIVSEHASTYLKEAADTYYKRHWLYKHQVKKIFGHADCVTNVSNAVGKILNRLFAIKKMSVIHNTVDVSVFKQMPRQHNQFTYIHVSSLSKQKNIFGILRSFKKLSEVRKDWKLILVGPYTNEIKEFIDYNNLGSLVELIGEVPYHSVAGFMQVSDVMVLFSKHENFPCVVIEALCSGVPVISSDVAGVCEAVNDWNGMLVQSGNEDDLLNSLLRIRDVHQLFDRVEISMDASKKYSYEIIGKQFHNLYTEIGYPFTP